MIKKEDLLNKIKHANSDGEYLRIVRKSLLSNKKGQFDL